MDGASRLMDPLSEYFGKGGKLKKSSDHAQVIWKGQNSVAMFAIYKLKNDCQLLVAGVKQISEWEKKQELKKKDRIKKGL